MNRRICMLTGLLLAAILLALVGPANITPAQAQGSLSRVRFLHAVPGAPSVDVYLDGKMVATNLGFGRVTPHLSVPGGDHQVTLRQTGLGMDAAPLIEVAVPLAPGFAFTVVAQGAQGAFEAALYEDILDELQPGMARLTAINTVSDAPALDVLTSEGGPLLQGINYGMQFGTINIPTGTQDLVMVPAGGAPESAIARIGQVSLQSGTLYTFVALGTLAGTTSTLVIATPVNGAADSVRVRFAQGSPDAPAVDIYANDTLIVPSLSLGQMTGHIALPAGDYTLAARPAGAPAADAPVASASVTLSDPAQTVVLLGQAADETLALQVFPDDVANLLPDQARVAVINAVTGATATASLNDPAATLVAENLAGDSQSSMTSVPVGEYMMTVSIRGTDNPVDVIVPATTYYGGMYYSVLVFGGGPDAVPFDARVAGTEINVTSGSLPVAQPVEVAAAPETPEPTQEAAAPAETEVAVLPTEAVTEAAPPPVATEAAPPPAETELVVAPTESSEVVAAPPTQSEVVAAQPTPPPAPTQAPAQPIVPQPQGPTAYVELNPGANLQCRELPGATRRSLGLIPSGSTLTVIGRTGTPLVPDTGGNPTPEPTPEVTSIEDLWLSVQWNPPSGGYVRCWVNAQYLRVEWKGKLLDTLDELWALPEVPFNQPGEVVGADVAPPTPLFNAVIATVELDPGVSLQLRRNPDTKAESLVLVPAGAQLEVLGYAEVPSEGLVGQPSSPYWLYVRYRTENGGATIGWVSAQYISLSQLGRPVELTSLPLVDAGEAGYYELPGQAPQIPVEQQDIVGVVNLNPGANLNLRDRPSADGRVVVGIPSGDAMVLNGRNGDGTWVQVTYKSATGDLEGWVAAQYLNITRGGQPYDIKGLPIVTGEEDTMGQVPTETPGQ
jgi:hypothetical protein